MKYYLKIMLLALVPFCAPGMHGQGPSNITVFYEDGFPSADAPVPDREILRKSFDRPPLQRRSSWRRRSFRPRDTCWSFRLALRFPSHDGVRS